MVVGGLSTFSWDGSAAWRANVGRRWKSLRNKRRASEETTSETVDGIELEGGPTGTTTPTPNMVTGADSSSATRQASTESALRDAGDDDKRSIAHAGGSQTAGVPSLASAAGRPASVVATEPEHNEEEEELAPSLYFKLGVKGGLALCVSRLPPLCLLVGLHHYKLVQVRCLHRLLHSNRRCPVGRRPADARARLFHQHFTLGSVPAVNDAILAWALATDALRSLTRRHAHLWRRTWYVFACRRSPSFASGRRKSDPDS